MKKELHFPGQRPNEHVILLLRRHWSIAVAFVLRLVVALLIPPIAITALVLADAIEFVPGTLLYVLIIEAFSLYYLFTFLMYFHSFVDYHLDIWVITNQRVVSIEQNGLFNRTIAELHIEKIQDVSSEIKGKVQTFLNFGQVYIQTAGASEKFSFEQVPNPSEVAKVILQIHDRMEHIGEFQRADSPDIAKHPTIQAQ